MCVCESEKENVLSMSNLIMLMICIQRQEVLNFIFISLVSCCHYCFLDNEKTSLTIRLKTMFSNSSKSALVIFSENYALVHGRIVFPLTIFGILTSLVTIVVLHRKNFRTPTNLILQHVAFFDTIVLISYNIYSLYFYILHQPNPFVGQSIFWPRFAIFHSNVGLTAHSIALWLTCLLAIVSFAPEEKTILIEFVMRKKKSFV